MDTDNLSDEAYQILRIATHKELSLDSELGNEAQFHKNEDEFLNGAINYLKEILEDPYDYLDFNNLTQKVSEQDLETKIKEILNYINQLKEN